MQAQLSQAQSLLAEAKTEKGRWEKEAKANVRPLPSQEVVGCRVCGVGHTVQDVKNRVWGQLDTF